MFLRRVRREAPHGLDDPLIDAPKGRVLQRVLPGRQPLVDAPTEVLGIPLDGLDDGAGPPLDDVFTPAVGVDVLVAGWGILGWRGEAFRRGGAPSPVGKSGSCCLSSCSSWSCSSGSCRLLAERVVLLADLAEGSSSGRGAAVSRRRVPMWVVRPSMRTISVGTEPL